MKTWLIVIALALFACLLVLGWRRDGPGEPSGPQMPSEASLSRGEDPPSEETHPPAETRQGFIYGRVTSIDGAIYEGRLRWGGDQEAFWDDHFNGSRVANPWLASVPLDQLPKERRPIEILGFTIAHREEEIAVNRQFLARFGDVARIEAQGREVRATLKSGTALDLDRFEASDFDDGLRVWDSRQGVVDLDSLKIRTIELLPAPPLPDAPGRLHGTVRTPLGDFVGFVAWNRHDGVGTDELEGRTAEGELDLRFDTINSIDRRSSDGCLVTLQDGRELVLSGTEEVGHGNAGVSVDDRRYGRVTISWDAFERVDFSPAGSGPAYGDFPPGSPLTGAVTTRDGRRLAGRLVYDVDESETTDTLDVGYRGVHYTIPFGLVASIAPFGPEGARLILHGGEELPLEGTGDVGEGNAGVLVFGHGEERPEYVAWTTVERIDFDRPPAMYPPVGERQGQGSPASPETAARAPGGHLSP